MYAAPAPPTDRIRRTYHTDVPEAGAAIITRRRRGRWETRIVGGRLDALHVQSRDWPEAADAHYWAVHLARQAAEAAAA